MNVRTEISMGLMSDGCTALYWKLNGAALLAQNWDVIKLQISKYYDSN